MMLSTRTSLRNIRPRKDCSVDTIEREEEEFLRYSNQSQRSLTPKFIKIRRPSAFTEHPEKFLFLTSTNTRSMDCATTDNQQSGRQTVHISKPIIPQSSHHQLRATLIQNKLERGQIYSSTYKFLLPQPVGTNKPSLLPLSPDMTINAEIPRDVDPLEACTPQRSNRKGHKILGVKALGIMNLKKVEYTVKRGDIPQDTPKSSKATEKGGDMSPSSPKRVLGTHQQNRAWKTTQIANRLMAYSKPTHRRRLPFPGELGLELSRDEKELIQDELKKLARDNIGKQRTVGSPTNISSPRRNSEQQLNLLAFKLPHKN